MNRGKLLPDGSRPTHEDIRESVKAWVQEISAKCAAYGIRAGVVLAVVPIDDPKPAYAYNLTPRAVQGLLRHVGDDIAATGGGIAIAPASALTQG